MKNILSIFLLIAVLVVAATAHAQPQEKVPKVGWLALRPTSSAAGIELFGERLASSAILRVRIFSHEYRSADNRLDRLPGLADELGPSKS